MDEKSNEKPKYATDRQSMLKVCRIDYFKAGGPGGQHKNKNQTAVRLLHKPSNTIVTASSQRSQKANFEVAVAALKAKLDKLNFVPKKRIPTKTPKSIIIKRKEDKKARSKKKQGRRSVDEDIKKISSLMK